MSPLAAKLLRLIFGLYFSVAIFTTGMQLYAEYTDERSAMIAEVSESVELIMPALGSALSNFEREVIDDILQALLKNRAITGLRMVGEIEVVEGRVDSENPSGESAPTSWISSTFKQPFVIENVDVDGTTTVIGFLYTYSHTEVLIARVENLFVSVLLSEFIKAAFLWLILYLVIVRAVAVPLVKLSQCINEINCEPGAGKKVSLARDSASGRVDELTSLFRVFVAMRPSIASATTEGSLSTATISIFPGSAPLSSNSIARV